ncbi:hypothetical protein LINPERHAP2_LOCUS31131 [Linum perenne]
MIHPKERKIPTISPTHIGRPFTSVDGAASETKNKDVVAQIIHSTIVGDHVMAAAYSMSFLIWSWGWTH